MAGERRFIPASEFCESVRDGTHDSPRPVDNGRKLVTSRHLTTGRLDLSDAYLISDEDFDAINKRSKVDRWDVLISMIGTVGEPCLIKEDPDFAIKNIGLFKTKSESDGKWLYYFLRSKDAQQSIREQSRGTTQQYIPLGALRNFPILVAENPEEQHAITSVLGALDDKIELNRRMNATLESMARALFQSWFIDFDPVRAKLDNRHPTGMDAETAALFPDHLENSDIGHIPKGWSPGKIADVGTNPRRSIQPNDIEASTPYIALEHMPRRSIALGDCNDSSIVASGKSAFKKGEILFGKLRPYFHKVGVAPFDGVCSTDILVLAPKSREWFGFLLGHASSDELIQFADLASTGTKMPRTSWSDLSSFKVALPPKPIAAAFTDVMQPMLDHIHANLRESRTLATLRDTLLPKLLSGELSVAGLESKLEIPS